MASKKIDTAGLPWVCTQYTSEQMELFIKTMMSSVNAYQSKNWTRAPECWMYPDDIDREDFRSSLYALEGDADWWSELLHKGSPVHLDAIHSALTAQNSLLKNTVLLSLIEVLWALDNNGEPVSRGMIAWFRANKFGAPPFSWEAGGSPPTVPSPKATLSIEKPLTLAEYIKLEMEEKKLQESIDSASDDESVPHVSLRRLTEVRNLLNAARARVIAAVVPSRTDTQ
jgi:hypothetical protein